MHLSSLLTITMRVNSVLVVIILIFPCSFVALKCRLNNGKSDEELKQVIRSCMKKVGTNGNLTDINYKLDDNDGKHDPYRLRNRDNLQMRSGNNYRSSTGQDTFKQDNRFRNQRTQQNGSCVVQCFFEELNLLNNEEYPDKQKVLHLLTKDVRDSQLLEFYTDTTRECFHFLEMEQKKDQCETSKLLITCLAEYARLYCEDWHDRRSFFT